ncbi:MAG: (Fe-S)-binding protein [Desulfatiglandales bacterium]
MLPVHPAAAKYVGIPGYLIAWFIFLVGVGLFCYIIYRRYVLLKSAQSDPRWNSVGKRVVDLIKFGIIQKRQPRYLWAGVIHIMIFWGFVVLGLRSMDLVTQGLHIPIFRPLLQGGFGIFYNSLKDIFELIVIVACIWAFLRRAILKPARYEGSHTGEAYLVLFLIFFLMVTDIFFEGSAHLLSNPNDAAPGWLPATRFASAVLAGAGIPTLQGIHHLTYWLHLLAFFFFLNLLPQAKHFHVITALPNVFLRNLNKGGIKPARWGVKDIEELESLGVGNVEEFTWKHMLDFFTCTECGRCSDNCPANMVGRPLSPKLLTLNLRDHAYRKYPVFSQNADIKVREEEVTMLGDIVSFEELWSCTTCGACEEECPVFIEYIDKIVDMRRHLIETAQNPKTFNTVLMQVEKTGNPFGKPAAKRGAWLDELEDVPPVRLLDEGDEVDVLYFVDGYASYDPAAQVVARAIVQGFNRAGIDFGILGPLEKDSGHQVRRMGEEGLFQLLVEENMETLKGIQFNRIVTTDPHAFNTLKKDYPGDFDVFHYTQFFASLVASGRLRPEKGVEKSEVYTYHDPCYLGRHNGVYEEPRRILRSIPGLNLVEMARSRDRSFCCGGGDIMLWHEIEQEEMRMASMRLGMAREVGANVIVTACPFCLIHFEDAIKTDGLEEQMKVIDLMEFFISKL